MLWPYGAHVDTYNVKEQKGFADNCVGKMLIHVQEVYSYEGMTIQTVWACCIEQYY